jgi:hypothetical protein
MKQVLKKTVLGGALTFQSGPSGLFLFDRDGGQLMWLKPEIGKKIDEWHAMIERDHDGMGGDEEPGKLGVQQLAAGEDERKALAERIFMGVLKGEISQMALSGGVDYWAELANRAARMFSGAVNGEGFGNDPAAAKCCRVDCKNKATGTVWMAGGANVMFAVPVCGEHAAHPSPKASEGDLDSEAQSEGGTKFDTAPFKHR